MKTALSLVAILLFTSAVIYAENPTPITAAVLDFQTSGESLRDKGAEVAALLGADLTSSENIFLVERAELVKILSEQELGLSGNVTPQSAAAVGQLTGAKVLISGRVFRAGDNNLIVAKVMSAETGRVYAETVSFAEPSQIQSATAELGKKVRSILETKSGTLLAKPETFEERIARLKKVVEGKKLPTVSVKVTEQHLSGPVIDPAVETEMRKVLQALGFDVIASSESGRTAEFAITGEAFSEAAGRRAGLVSCRSRAEVQVTNTATGKVVLSDRQVSVAVDVAEAVAGKRALENAALGLLDRIVPTLVSQ